MAMNLGENGQNFPDRVKVGHLFRETRTTEPAQSLFKTAEGAKSPSAWF